MVPRKYTIYHRNEMQEFVPARLLRKHCEGRRFEYRRITTCVVAKSVNTARRSHERVCESVLEDGGRTGVELLHRAERSNILPRVLLLFSLSRGDPVRGGEAEDSSVLSPPTELRISFLQRLPFGTGD